MKRACRAPYETTSHTAVKRPQMSRSAPIALTCLRLVYGQTVPRIAGQCILPMQQQYEYYDTASIQSMTITSF